MVRSAAKNFQDVAIVTSPADYAAIAEEMASPAASCRWQPSGGWRRRRSPPRRLTTPPSPPRWSGFELTPTGSFADPPAPRQFPADAAALVQQSMDLRYGENPHQKAALYSDGSGAGVANGKQLQGKELTYNNIVDLQAAWDLAQEFDEPVCAIIKHTNPCGTATGKTLAEAYKRALECDPVSAFGGVIGVNRAGRWRAAEEMAKLFRGSDRRAGVRSRRRARCSPPRKTCGWSR